jgi:hypothetical protein
MAAKQETWSIEEVDRGGRSTRRSQLSSIREVFFFVILCNQERALIG